MTTVYSHSFETPLGTFRTAATDTALALIYLPGGAEAGFLDAVRRRFGDAPLSPGGPINTEAERQITAYLRGELRAFSLPHDLKATPFQAEVLHAVAAIPYGETRTYAQIARAVNSPRAVRAVGSANARNCLPLVIPCHRVVASHGLGGYGGGLDMKRKLLRLEGAI